MPPPPRKQDMIALAEVLMLPGGAPHLESADFSLARLRSHGAIVLAKCIAHTSWRSIELRQIRLPLPDGTMRH
jgi:hypothetical protein